MPEPEYRLVKHFIKPQPGEFVPIIFIEMIRETVGWSPKLNKSVYVGKEMGEAGELKRMREVNVLKVVNQFSDSMSIIEIDDEEKEQFEEIYKEYLKKGGQILFSRKKVGRKNVAFFELLDVKSGKREAIVSTILSDMLEETQS
ncbi:MAG TPA: hypothetical protein VIO11_09890 [Candidatus Methanoperedens sp.]